MSLRFRRSMSIGKLFKINFSKSGIGFSAGVPGFRVSVGADGKVRRTVGLPGTGISHTEVIGGKKADPAVRRCGACGHRLSKTDRYCPNCGEKCQ